MKTVLFVCIGNSCRSQMAEGFFNHYAPEGYRAESAGTAPADSVSSTAETVMEQCGISLEGHFPKKLTDQMLENADRVISMGCMSDMCPTGSGGSYADWGIEDPVGQGIDVFERIRDTIRDKVIELVEQCQSENK